MATTYDAIIIGAGVIGGCLGFELAKRGYKTLNVDKLGAAGHGSTGASCAIIRVHYSTFDGVAIANEGVWYWKNWADYLGADDEAGFATYRNVGCVVTKTPHNDNLVNVLANLNRLGIAHEEWSADELVRHVPVVDPSNFWPVRRRDDPAFGVPTGERIAGAVFTPGAGYVSDPQLTAHNAERAAEAAGGRFRFNAEVAAIRQAGGRVQGVTLKDGERIDAPVVVNVAGPHSHVINRMAGVVEGMRFTTRALRVEVAHVPAPAGFDFENLGCVFSDGDIGCYFRPEKGNHILVGSEDPECDPREWVDPDDFDRSFTDQWTNQVYRLGQRIPGIGIPNTATGIVDCYDVSDDWIPIYDRSDLDGFYMAIGTSGNQFKNAPVVGAVMAELIERCEHGHDHDRDPIQFPLVHTAETIDLGYCSRRREINEASSFSVIG